MNEIVLQIPSWVPWEIVPGQMTSAEWLAAHYPQLPADQSLGITSNIGESWSAANTEVSAFRDCEATEFRRVE